MRNIFYIAELDFENTNASTARVINNIKSLQMDSNINVTIIGYGNKPELVIEGIKVINLPRGKSKIIKFLNYILRPINILSIVKHLVNGQDIVFYYGTSSHYLFPLLHLKKKIRYKLVADVVEWYDYSSLPFGKFGLVALNVHLAMTKLIPKCDGIIAISSFLKRYYEKEHKHKNVIQIPVTVDTRKQIINEGSQVEFDEEYLNLIYAGIPGNKDILSSVIQVVSQLFEEKYKIRLYLLGFNKKDNKQSKGLVQSDGIIYLGRIEQNKVQFLLSKADFSVLIRPDKRYAHAGFSTKFVESLNAKLPVIANLTGDIGEYLKSDFNGFVLEDYHSDTLKNLLLKLLSTPKEEFSSLKENARKTAENNFDYKLYSKDINIFTKDTRIK